VVDLTDAEWREFQSIPEQGYSHRHWVNHKIAQRLEAVSAERDEARHWAKTMQSQKFEWEDKEAAARAERNEALAAIADIRAMLPGPRTFAESLMRDFAGNLWPQSINADEVARILSRIPEHPKQEVDHE
jgi:hypothetical protein